MYQWFHILKTGHNYDSSTEMLHVFHYFVSFKSSFPKLVLNNHMFSLISMSTSTNIKVYKKKTSLSSVLFNTPNILLQILLWDWMGFTFHIIGLYQSVPTWSQITGLGTRFVLLDPQRDCYTVLNWWTVCGYESSATRHDHRWTVFLFQLCDWLI